MASRRSGTRRPRRDIRVGVAGTPWPALAPSRVRGVVAAVLDWEGTGEAAFSITFLGPSRMRALNRRTFGRDRVTDVIAFELPHTGRPGGDLYLCPAAARAAAVAEGVPLADELVRVLVHGTLHALGYRHAEGDGRTRSPMWRRQERYVRALVAGGR